MSQNVNASIKLCPKIWPLNFCHLGFAIETLPLNFNPFSHLLRPRQGLYWLGAILMMKLVIKVKLESLVQNAHISKAQFLGIVLERDIKSKGN